MINNTAGKRQSVKASNSDVSFPCLFPVRHHQRRRVSHITLKAAQLVSTSQKQILFQEQNIKSNHIIKPLLSARRHHLSPNKSVNAGCIICMFKRLASCCVCSSSRRCKKSKHNLAPAKEQYYFLVS